MRILDQAGALSDPRALEVALKLMDRSKELRETAGGLIGVGWGPRRVIYGLDL